MHIPKAAKYYILPTPGQDITGDFYFYLEMLDKNKHKLSYNKYRFQIWRQAGNYCRELRGIFKEAGLIEIKRLYESSAPRGHQYPYI